MTAPDRPDPELPVMSARAWRSTILYSALTWAVVCGVVVLAAWVLS